MKQRGFTLVEIAVVLVIIGLILGGILSSQSIISSSRASDVIAMVNDLRTATTYFKQRYNYLPGDLPNPANYITAVPALAAGTGGNIGDGKLDGGVTPAGLATVGSEVAQAPWQLYNARLIGAVNSGNPASYLSTIYGPVQMVSQATADLLVPGFAAANPNARNAIVFFNLPCDVANQVDLKLDDGNLATGHGLGKPKACTLTNSVNAYALPL
jgi:prepilin-type N-terminal cleavage/methylation domain-containing protein